MRLPQGVVVEALNPGTAAFFLTFLPRFVDVPAGHVAFQFAVLGIVSVTLDTLADLGVAVIAGRAHAGPGARLGRARPLREISGCAMVVLGLGLLLARRPAS